MALIAATQTLTNKSLSLTSNTVTMTAAELNTAVTDDNVAFLGAANTFTAAQVLSSTLSMGGTAITFGALPSGATTTGTLATFAAQTYTVTGTNTATAFQAAYNGVPTFTNASAGTVTDLFSEVWAGPAAVAGSQVATRRHTLGILDGTSAVSSITGGLVVAATFGTIATSVGIGGGNVYAGGIITCATWNAPGTSATFYGYYPTTVTKFGSYLDGSKISFAIDVTNGAGFGYLAASAVSATACALTATGSGSNIDINLTPKGTGAIVISEAGNLSFGTTTGTKIGAATSQKIGFWNATPIVQPTTAIAAATIASTGAGDVVAASTTFDGYTIPQIVKALRNAGLLA